MHIYSYILIITDTDLNFQHFFFEILISKLTTLITNIHTLRYNQSHLFKLAHIIGFITIVSGC